MKNKNKYTYALMSLATITTLATAIPALADTTSTTTPPVNAPVWGNRMMGGTVGVGLGRIMRPGVFGTVSAVSGNIITVTSTRRMMGLKNTNTTSTTTPTTNTTTYTVDATNAKITKNNVAGSISSIVVGDTIMVQGTLTGTNLVATTIRDGIMTRKTPGVDDGKNQTSPITGNGQPIVAGTVSTINGSTLTITNKSNVSYTVDATNAKIAQGANTIAIGGIAVGDMVVVQGTINGSSVVASSVIDQKPLGTTTDTTTMHRGFFGSIGSFFSHLFGF